MKTNSKSFKQACKNASHNKATKSAIEQFCLHADCLSQHMQAVTREELEVICLLVWNPRFDHPLFCVECPDSLSRQLDSAITAMKLMPRPMTPERKATMKRLSTFARRLNRMTSEQAYCLYVAAWLFQFAPEGTPTSDFFITREG